MSRSGEINDTLGSSDYGMEENSGGSEQYHYHREDDIGRSDREDDYEQDPSGGDYYEDEESNNDESSDMLAVEDDIEEDGDSPNLFRNSNDDSRNISDFFGQGSERVFSVQNLLGNIAQGIENNDERENENADNNTSPFGNRRGLGNLADAFPEIISLLNDGVRRSNNGGRNDRLSNLVNNVSNATEDPYIAMESLKELAQYLLMTDQLIIERTLPMEKLLKGILHVLSEAVLADELELQLVACRCLYNLFEVNPDSISLAVDQGIITKLQGKLQEISYIDLAEQVLETLELISRLHGKEILRSGALSVCLQYIDFFTIHAQRKAVSIVSNSCCKVRTDDFEIIRELFIILKPLFVNGSDPVIVDKLLKALYGICEGLRKKCLLESLFSSDIIHRLGQLISISETSLESKLRCLDIMSVLLSSSGRLSKEFIENCDVIGIFMNCLNGYSKNQKAALHETLIYIPKNLLYAITRTIVLIFPTEKDQVLSMDGSKKLEIDADGEKFERLLNNLTPLLVEIYLNTVDFDVRRLVLIALARVATCIKETRATKLAENIMGLAGSTLAQSDILLTEEDDQIITSCSLIVGVLSLLDILATRFSAAVLAPLKREGIFNLVENLRTTLLRGKEEGKIIIPTYDSDVDGTSTSESGCPSESDENEEGDDDEYDMQFNSLDLPKEVKPNTIKFDVLRTPFQGLLYRNAWKLSENLLTNFEVGDGDVSKEIRNIEELATFLNSNNWKGQNDESWRALWKRIRDCLFKQGFEISSFEAISTGLVSALSDFITKFANTNLLPRRTFLEVFGDDNAKKLVSLLQGALTRLESFPVVECGLQGSEERVASLGKQVKIKLVYDNECDNDAIARTLSNATIYIHCIASFKTLNEFLKHRMAQAKFLSTLLPNSSSPGAGINDNGIEEIRDWVFEFSTEQEDLKLTDTIFFAIYRAAKAVGKDSKALWNEPQVIKFKKIDEKETTRSDSLMNIYNHDIANDKGLSDPTDNIFNLLKFLKLGGLPADIFVNSKLSAKLSRQLEEPLIVASGVLPDWTLQITKKYSFLFPFDTRLFFLQCTSFGYGRLIQLWRNKTGNSKDSNSDDPLQKLGRITRHKLRISRSTLFLSALKILDKYGGSPSVLEIEYQDEVGTGLGPTLEFYACVSQEFTKKNLQMWRFDSINHQDSEYVTSPLFPAPLTSTENNEKILELFYYLGTFVARSMLDNRILDFNYNKSFFELTHRRFQSRNGLVFNESLEDKFYVLSLIDEQLAKSLKFLRDHSINRTDIDQLALYFILPGYEWDLIENGSNVQVTSENVNEYIDLVLESVIGKGINKQLDQFIDGVSKVFPYASLLLLNPEELTDLYGSVQEDWSAATLYSTINADHGYTMDSPSIHELVSIMSSFSLQERRLFLQFLTGSPRLPIGGFKSLKPKLTVVLKHPDEDQIADSYLPSAMTCANYFKLPKYSGKTIMRSRIVQAMNEGMGPFLLS